MVVFIFRVAVCGKEVKEYSKLGSRRDLTPRKVKVLFILGVCMPAVFICINLFSSVGMCFFTVFTI